MIEIVIEKKKEQTKKRALLFSFLIGLLLILVACATTPEQGNTDRINITGQEPPTGIPVDVLTVPTEPVSESGATHEAIEEGSVISPNEPNDTKAGALETPQAAGEDDQESDVKKSSEDGKEGEEAEQGAAETDSSAAVNGTGDAKDSSETPIFIVPIEPIAGERISSSGLPEYNVSPYCVVNDNLPIFRESEKGTVSFECYGQQDSLGRCTIAYANIGQDLMPTEERGAIGMVKPAGWQIAKYEFVDGLYLFNRCHMIGYQLTAENANRNNLFVGTRYLNVEGMLPFENKVATYIRRTGNHVLYRVSLIYTGDNLVADGVQLEAWSVEDDGAGVSFNVFCYNVQPGVEIDYKTGESREKQKEVTDDPEREYVLNISNKKFHRPDCKSVDTIKDKNRKDVTATRSSLLDSGYSPCGNCNS